MNRAPIKPNITADVLDKIDIRAGTILAVDDVPNSDKLLQLRVTFGDHERIILSGMKQERANPQELVGRQTLFVVNLEPRKMRGIESNGMILMAEDSSGKLHFINPDDDTELGSVVS